MGRGACIIILLGLLLCSPMARAEDPAQPVPNDKTCPVPPDGSWTSQERCVWQRVCAGAEANFNRDPAFGGGLDPRKPEGLPDSRVLRPSFLETILLKNPYRHALTRVGVRITGARFKERLDLRNAEIRHELWLDRSLFEKGADLSDAVSTQRITLDGTKIVGDLDLRGLTTDRDLTMALGSEAVNVYLRRARIGEQLNLSGLTATGQVAMAQARIGQAVLGSGSSFGELDLWDATVDGSLDLSGDSDAKPPVPGASVSGDLLLSDTQVGNWLSLNGATVKKKLDMGELRVGHSLYMRTHARFSDVLLRNAQIGGQLDLTGSKVSKTLDLGGITVAREVLMFATADAPSEFADVDLSGAHIGGDLSLTGAKFTKSLDMDTAQIGLSLYLRNGVFADVSLRGARIGADLSAAGS